MSSPTSASHASPTSSAAPSHYTTSSSDSEYISASESARNNIQFNETQKDVNTFQKLLQAIETEHHHDAAAHLYSAHLINRMQRWQQEVQGDKVRKGRLIRPSWANWPVKGSRKRVVQEGEGEEEEKTASEALREAILVAFMKKARLRLLEEQKDVPEEERREIESDDDQVEYEVRPLISNLMARMDVLLKELHRERMRYWYIPRKDAGSGDDEWEDEQEDGDEESEYKEKDTKHSRKRRRERRATVKHERKRIRRSNVVSRERYENSVRYKNMKLKARDWSAILGLAATQGWNNIPSGGYSRAHGGTIDRASARCSALFDERMEFTKIKVQKRLERNRPRTYLCSMSNYVGRRRALARDLAKLQGRSKPTAPEIESEPEPEPEQVETAEP